MRGLRLSTRPCERTACANTFALLWCAFASNAWVFVLRAGADTGAERHPNSHQRMMSFEGSGNLQTGKHGKWESNVLVSDPDAPLERRWISIPTNVWHRPVINASADWAVISFHTVPAEELIEERPDDSRETGTRQMKYFGK